MFGPISLALMSQLVVEYPINIVLRKDSYHLPDWLPHKFAVLLESGELETISMQRLEYRDGTHNIAPHHRHAILWCYP